MADRDGEYVLVRNRKAKKSRQYYYDDDDDDDDDNDSQIYRRIARRKARNRYFSSDDIESDYRHQPRDVCVLNCIIESYLSLFFYFYLAENTNSENSQW